MKFPLALLLILLISAAHASETGQRIYLTGEISEGQAVNVIVNDLESEAALGCVNCHRESGLGGSESGTTIPPVSWRLLARDQPSDKFSRFYSIQNKRPGYTPGLLHRLLTTGINSAGKKVNPLMPRYSLSQQQTGELVEYLTMLFPKDDPGVDSESIIISTLVDSRLPEARKRQHIDFLQGLFAMKNSGTRGELKRKKYAAIQKAPQYESYRRWELRVWELPANTTLWKQVMNDYYSEQPVFVMLTPLLKGDYPVIQEFCNAKQLPCLFSHNSEGSSGDYYNFVFRDVHKQRKDYIARKFRSQREASYFLETGGNLEAILQDRVEVPAVGKLELQSLASKFSEICVKEITLIMPADLDGAQHVYSLECPGLQKLKIKLLGEPGLNYSDIAELTRTNPNPNICWVTSYNRSLKRNTSKLRVDAMTRKFGMEQSDSETLAEDLYAFGLLADSLHQLAGNYSRHYLIEIIEHMLNSYPNTTYFNSLSGAPGQRAIVGPLKEVCLSEGRA